MKFNPTHVQKWVIMSVLMVLAVAVLIGGMFARMTVLNANPCQMTYSHRDKKEIPMCGKNCEYKLFKITNAQNRKLNNQPVLYIPGHLGSSSQARSIASHMHNEVDNFQYFALDFAEGYSALHGSDVFAQAYVVNQALVSIQNLYKNKKPYDLGLNPNSTRKIILVGHSVGGMVARAAPLLSNHPACAVREIFQLSSPNNRPPYSPDASLETAYSLVNQAWTSIYRNSSFLPEMCAHLPDYTATSDSSAIDRSRNTVYNSSDSEKAHFVCPRCIQHMRLISISGGDVELEVPPELSDLNTLFPAPALSRRVAAARPKDPASEGMVFRVVKGVVNYSIKTVLNAVGFGSANATVAAGNETVSMDAVGMVGAPDGSVNVTAADDAVVDNFCMENSTCSNSNIASESVSLMGEGEVSITPAVISSVEASPLAAVSEPPVVTGDVSLLDAPPSVQFVSLRTSQLVSVGFPVDHAAIVWCYEALQAVTHAMAVLSMVEGTVTVDWEGAFPTRNASTQDSAKYGLGTMAFHLNHRRQSAKSWMEAVRIEYTHVTSNLKYRYLMEFPFAFVSHHLLKIVVCYLIVSCLVLSAPLLRTLTGNSGGTASSNWDNLLPWNHFSVDVLYSGVFSVMRSSAPPQLLPHMFTVLYQLVAVVIAVKGTYEYISGTFQMSAYTKIVHWFVAYLLALGARAILLLGTLSVQSTSSTVYSVVRSVLRYTVWNQTIRRAVRSAAKSVHATLASKLPFYSTCASALTKSVALLAVSAVWGAVYVTSMGRLSDSHIHALGRVTYGLSVLVVVAYVLLCSGLLVSLMLPTSLHKKASSAHTYYNTDLVLLYLPAPVLAFPTFYASYRILYGQHVGYNAVTALYGVLDMSRVWYCVAVVAVGAHLWVARSPSTLPNRAKPLRFLYELLGPHNLQAYTDICGSTYTCSGANNSDSHSGGVDNSMLNTAINSGANGCIHEDGGRHAVFEQISVDAQGNEAKSVAHGVIMGSTYKVVSCNCAKDNSLSEIADWCSWCKCRNCGGKHLPASSKMKFNAHFGAINPSELVDFTFDFLPLVVLPVVAWMAWYYVQDSPYLYLYALGVVALSFVGREIAYSAP